MSDYTMIFSVVVVIDGEFDEIASYRTHAAATEMAAAIAREKLEHVDLPDFIQSPDDLIQYLNETGEGIYISVQPHALILD